MALQHSLRIVTDGLVLALDAGNPKNYNAGISTNWVDSVGGNNGTLIGGTYHTDGPFVGAGYVEFDGTGDYLQISNNVDFQFGTGDFTIEGWFYADSQPNNYQTLFSVGSYTTGILLRRHRSDTSSNDNFYINNTLYDYDESFFPLNTWVHFAVTRQSGAVNLWIDGVSRLSPTNTSNLTPTDDLYIGTSQHSTGDVWLGKISNFRIVKGTALYTSDFTPLTEPLTNVTNTTLLTCQGNTIEDASSSAHTITVNGDAAANLGFPASAFEFDGTDDYVDITWLAPLADTSAVTMEAWVNVDTLTNTYQVIGTWERTTNHWQFTYSGDTNFNISFGVSGSPYHAGTTSAPATGSWQHVVATWNGGSISTLSDWKIYVNGVSQTIQFLGNTGTSGNDSYIGTRQGLATNNMLDGKIGQIRYYSRALTASEVAQNYNALKGRYLN